MARQLSGAAPRSVVVSGDSTGIGVTGLMWLSELLRLSTVTRASGMLRSRWVRTSSYASRSSRMTCMVCWNSLWVARYTD